MGHTTAATSAAPVAGVYATSAQLATYLGTAAPADADRLLSRASELIDEHTFGRIDTTDADHVLAAQNATCAQVEFWIAEGEERDTHGPNTEYSVGKVSIKQGANAPQYLAPRAKRYLFLAGLLYRGANVLTQGGIHRTISETVS